MIATLINDRTIDREFLHEFAAAIR